MKHALVILALLAGCPKTVQPPDIAPPITEGKCVADHYEGRIATKQVCNYAGYAWDCGPANCDRKGEAVGERPLLETK